MGSNINKYWLGFSLSSPHHQQQHHSHQSSVSDQLGFNSDEISATQLVSGECFDLMITSDVSTIDIPSLNLPPAHFAILEAFNRDTNTQSHQDWNMKDVGTNPFSCSSENPHQNQETPKLENFLGHSFADNNCNNQEQNNINYIYQEAEAISHTNNSTMGLSMTKNWLRNNPAPTHPADNKVGNEAAAAPPPGGAQTLSLSMSTGSQSSDSKLQRQCGAAVDSQSSGGSIESVPRKSLDTIGQRTSLYRGVTRHRWTRRYEAHLWDNSCSKEGQTRKGRQVYLGGYDKEEKAARAYDLAALKYWGATATTNFPISKYEKEMEEMKCMTRQEYVASLRRKSSGFSRGASIYRGVTRHQQHGRWQARIGRVAGNKDLYLGTFSTQEEAAKAYDIAAIKFRGLNALTNFEMSRYDVKSILESRTVVPIRSGTRAAAAKRLKDDDCSYGWPPPPPYNGNGTSSNGSSSSSSSFHEEIIKVMNNNGYHDDEVGLFGSADHQQATNLCYQSHLQSSSNQGTTTCYKYSNWINPTAGTVPALAAASVCHGASPFAVYWNHT